MILGAVALIVWLGMLFAHGGFWRARERDTIGLPGDPAIWPAVTAVVPARDEAEVIARSIGSLLAQDYPGVLRVVLVDDSSSDGTGDIARGLGSERLSVIIGKPLAAGWTGKLWAVSQGIAAASSSPAGGGGPSEGWWRGRRPAESGSPSTGFAGPPPRSGEDEEGPRYIWLTDADIEHAPDTLRTLVRRAEGEGRALVSLMARLRCDTMAERALVPAFVFFFQMLYPFSRVNRPTGMGAAAGGCMLVRREALERAGGIGAIRDALVDDCAFGALIKRQGPVWLGLTDRSVSIRPYDTLDSVGAMISRSAYAQLRYSPLALLGTLLGLALVFVVPPALALFGSGVGRIMGALAWALMALSFQPMLRFYRRSPLWGIALPAIAAYYGWCTFLSGWQHHRGRGGMWKGRAQAAVGH